MNYLRIRILNVVYASACALYALVVSIGLQAQSTTTVNLQLVAEGFTSPLSLVPIPDKSGRSMVVDQAGTISVLDGSGKVSETLALDLRTKLAKLNAGFDERGATDIAFHPKFSKNRRVFVTYSAPKRDSAPKDWDHTLRLSEFKASEKDAGVLLADSEKVVLEIDQPQMNHNCGRIVFGPDGFLYMGAGDGGAANDTGVGHSANGNGQDLTTLLGKILRLDVDKGTPYGIPKANPFADGKNGRPEIYAYGFRNPWGISFDRGGKRELFAVDVGQTLYEELNIVTKGGNYGWRLREANIGFDPANPNKPAAETPKVGLKGEPLVDPVLAYKNVNGFRRDADARGISVTGGYVYRGKALKGLVGKYIFADWSKNWALADGQLFAATRPQGKGGEWTLDVMKVGNLPGGKIAAYVVGMGQDAAAELYVLVNGSNQVTGKSGKIYKIVSH